VCRERVQRHDGIYYYHHLIDVTQILLNLGIRDENIITAALLHDIIEDVPGYTVEKVASLFNPVVADYVSRVSKPKGFDPNNPEHFKKYRQGIIESVGSALLKVVDIMHNFGTMKNAPLEKRYRKAKEIKMYYIDMIKECRELYIHYEHIFFQAKTHVESFLWCFEEPHEEMVALQNELETSKKENQSLQEENEALKKELEIIKMQKAQ